jgi:hypothetical protein
MWQAWLRNTVLDPPSIKDLENDVARYENVKHIANQTKEIPSPYSLDVSSPYKPEAWTVKKPIQ